MGSVVVGWANEDSIDVDMGPLLLNAGLPACYLGSDSLCQESPSQRCDWPEKIAVIG